MHPSEHGGRVGSDVVVPVMTPTGAQLLGREGELQLVTSVLDVAGGGNPGFVLVSGEAGIGKTRLLEELAEIAVGRGYLTLEGRAAEFEREFPFGVLIHALDPYLRSLDARALDRLATDRLGELAAVFPSLRELGEAVEYPVSALERFRVYQAVRELVERLAARSVLVLILDDLQWADGASLELMSYLLRRPPQASVMIALALRTGLGDAAVIKTIGDIERSSIAHTIELGPLTREGVRQLVGDVEGLDVERLQHESGGNPFFALQLARARVDEADTASDGGLGVPPTVARAIAAELEELSPDARTLAVAAAVVGDPFELDLAVATLDAPESEVWERIDELVSKDLVRGTEVPRTFQFRHPLVRRAVYGSCSPSVRISCHRRAVTALAERAVPAAVLAGHVEQSARHGDAFAIETLRRAGEETSRQAPGSAASWFAAALRLLPADVPVEERVGLLVSLATAETATGRFSEAHAALDECIALTPAEDVERRVELVVGTAQIEQLLGRHNEARRRLQRAHEELEDLNPSARVSLLIALSTNSLFLADHAGMLEWGRLAVEAADAVGDDTLAAAALAAYTMGATFAGRIDLARELHGRAAFLVDSLDDDRLVSRLDALSNLATAELYLDLHSLTCRHGERGLFLARSTGRTQLVPILIPILGCSLWMTGEMARSAEVLDEAIESARVVDNAQGLSLALFNRALSAVMAGDVETALGTGAESVELARQVDNGVITAFAGAIHAQALCEAGEPERAVELLLESVGGEDIPLLAGSWRATFFELLTRCRIELGQLDEARAAAVRVRQQADEHGLQLSGLMADRAGAAVALAEGRPDDAADLAMSAVAQSEEIGARVHAATSRALAGRSLAAAGRSDEAIDQLVRAADEFDSLGTLRYRDQSEAQLRNLGHAVHRRTRRGGPEAFGVKWLTGRELEVAELVRGRRTNREIAEELFLSLKTVEAHMRNIFHKLDVSSRAEVAQLIGRARTADGRS
jgi:DNA-binding NarL/FixJ family response regulator